ncbi:hypothetical protein DFH08DRAFT_811615 [Mycena albidolilacea]|uniref:Uncharacterized protein n=1 Tax=Mycena albidolilacea TaxID=1033008 RepID=A0AAD7EPX3_9AGAR|nr:hypothetical protein DFH08DRAFT_811615 [Mycena albidolilacea]
MPGAAVREAAVREAAGPAMMIICGSVPSAGGIDRGKIRGNPNTHILWSSQRDQARVQFLVSFKLKVKFEFEFEFETDQVPLRRGSISFKCKVEFKLESSSRFKVVFKVEFKVEFNFKCKCKLKFSFNVKCQLLEPKPKAKFKVKFEPGQAQTQVVQAQAQFKLDSRLTSNPEAKSELRLALAFNLKLK